MPSVSSYILSASDFCRNRSFYAGGVEAAVWQLRVPQNRIPGVCAFPAPWDGGCPAGFPLPGSPIPKASVRSALRILGTPCGMSPADAPLPETFPLHHFPDMCFESVCFS